MLVSELPTFLKQYQIFATVPNTDNVGRERVIGALGCLIQALDSEDTKIEALQSLIPSISTDFLASNHLLNIQQDEPAKERVLLALNCLLSLGKALQSPSDTPILIDDDEVNVSKAPTSWDHGTGRDMQSAMANMLGEIAATWTHDREVLKVTFDVLRCGFSEKTPGLLVFPAHLVVSFLLDCAHRSPFYDITLGTATAFLCWISPKEDGECRRLSQYVLGLSSLERSRLYQEL
jgi:hypothetical protein